MLINQNHIPIWVLKHDIGGSFFAAFFGAHHQFCAFYFEQFFDFTHIDKGVDFFAIFVPTWIERQHIAFKHPLKQANSKQ